ncbi:uncharacterized protein LOC129732167 [Wyeomyia smithii]|uniref:uncharacterized protein LOC129732167 n=1 Tax=Wyeomyia smithii TaxID=174621 RepID=UPI0024681FF3|nr:uncharacterized protein LOC129732167 [Wyeomyia smithii]XP_055548717.1 uncharacterized protein LOC129732167 [Wyeomyia smithii]
MTMSVERRSQGTMPLAPKIWTRDEIFTFLDIFESTFHASVSDPFDSESDMWECISEKLQTAGCIVSPQHCQSKWNLLYKTFTQAPNRQSVFYPKIKQIVEFSQQISEDQSEESSPAECKKIEEIDQYEIITSDIRPEDFNSIEGMSEDNDQCTDKSKNLEERLETEKITNTSSSHLETTRENLFPIVSSETINSDNDNSRVDAFECKCSSKHCVNNLGKMLKDIFTKLDAIHNEQIGLKNRLTAVEKLQSENNKLLFEIKTSSESKKAQ